MESLLDLFKRIGLDCKGKTIEEMRYNGHSLYIKFTDGYVFRLSDMFHCDVAFYHPEQLAQMDKL